MKRGLKVVGKVLQRTESDMVSTLAPMKRGLKCSPAALVFITCSRFNLCPDEKGTEIDIYLATIILFNPSFNLCPDEKGTEILLELRDRAFEASGFNLCPDEKGTEIKGVEHDPLSINSVSTFAPTKRGLKFTPILPNWWAITWFQPLPRRKGD